MENSKGLQACQDGKVELAQSSQSGNAVSSGTMPVSVPKTMPITEISDKDYRSICWPCDVLEDSGDDKPES
jgi:hypothetical protein